MRSASRDGDEFRNFRPGKCDFDDERVTLVLMAKIQSQFCGDEAGGKHVAKKLDAIGKSNRVSAEMMGRIEGKMLSMLHKKLSFDEMMH